MQELLVYIALAIALVYLVKKYFFKSKNKSSCGTGCGTC
ncbi:MAG: FeoB-associated Cys-rich membrane protein [Lutibacter sp.]|nr:FeoB-associated Cys-rich membrane protein [Lutibacter sp.]MBP9601064.1 FeoB-associated Cys-rich membrane protein [Lutibacter sp.]